MVGIFDGMDRILERINRILDWISG
jgi:hypothetical protein